MAVFPYIMAKVTLIGIAVMVWLTRQEAQSIVHEGGMFSFKSTNSNSALIYTAQLSSMILFKCALQ